MTGRPVPRALSDAWAQQRLWSRTATRLRRRLDRARTGALVLAIAAAVLAVAAVQLAGTGATLGRALGAAAAVSAGLTTLLQGQVDTHRIRAWIRARSASEGLKSEVYAYLAGGSAYADPAVRDHVLAERTRRLVDDLADLQRLTLGTAVEEEPLPAVNGLEDYLTRRVDEQITGYYRPRAVLYERRVRRLRTVGVALGVATVLLSAVAASFEVPSLAAWVPVATTAGTALAAHVAATRYDHLVVEYLRTARRLEHLRGTRDGAPGSGARLVDACEDAIAAENRGWTARWTADDADSPQQRHPGSAEVRAADED